MSTKMMAGDDIAYSGLPQPAGVASPAPPKRSSNSFLRWVVVAFMVFNIAYFQCHLAPSRAKLAELRGAMQSCSADDSSVFSDFVAREMINTVKQDPTFVSTLSARAGTYAAANLKEAYTTFLAAASTSTRGELFPDNIFLVADNLITANFTPLLYSLHTFFHQLAQGIASEFAEHVDYCDYYYGWDCWHYYDRPSISEVFEYVSTGMKIAAENVMPLTHGLNYTKDKSVLGSFLTDLPIEVEKTISNVPLAEKTGHDCMILMTRLYSTDWTTAWRSPDGETHYRNYGGNVQAFKSINRGCEVAYFGAQVPTKVEHL